MTAVDSFAVKQLVKLEEKVPSIKTETDDVLEALGERKNAVCARINGGREAIAGRLANGKEAISTTLHSGKEAVVGRIQAGSEAIANSGPGCLVGSGVTRTLQVTENVVDYLLPEEKTTDGKEENTEKEETDGEAKVTSELKDEDIDSEESEGEEDVKPDASESSVERAKNLSRKVKLRIYYRTLRRLDTVQQQCKSTLEQLKLHVDLVS